MPKPYVVPGGRFREGYYWDTYFTMLGLQEAGREDLVDDMLDNFAYLIDTLRPYSERQPHVLPEPLAAAVLLVHGRTGRAEGRRRVYQTYLPQMRREYAYWMQGASALAARQGHAPTSSCCRTARCSTATGTTPTHRATSRTCEDVETAKRRRAARRTRSTATCAPPPKAAGTSARAGSATTRRSRRSARPSIMPVDLNSLLFHLETTIARGCGEAATSACVGEFVGRAAKRARGHRPVPVEPERLLRRLRLAAREGCATTDGRDALSAVRRRRAARSRRTDARSDRGATAEAGRPRDDDLHTRPAMGRTQRLGAAALDRRSRGSKRYGRADLAQPIGTRFLADVKQVYATASTSWSRSTSWTASGRAGRRRRISVAGRLRLDQRRDAATARSARPGSCRAGAAHDACTLRALKSGRQCHRRDHDAGEAQPAGRAEQGVLDVAVVAHAVQGLLDECRHGPSVGCDDDGRVTTVVIRADP